MKALFLALVLISSNALACSCADFRDSSAATILAEAEYAFVGSYISAKTDGTFPDSTITQMVTTFRVKEAFKPKNMRSKIVVRSEKGDGANCGTGFKRGGKYLIFAYKNNGRIYTDGCSYDDVDGSSEIDSLILALRAASSR